MSAPEDITFLMTAEEAFPAFERAVLAAESHITAGFRIFDPATRLRSAEGCRVGVDWFDLIEHILRRGVRFDLMISDFDPIVKPAMHHLTWSSIRKLYAIAEISDAGHLLRVRPMMHPVRAGLITRLLLWPRVRRELAEVVATLNAMPPERRRARFRDMPRLHEWLTEGADGRLRMSGKGLPQLYPVTHHQKIAVIDDAVVYVGGLDLNPRRYDTLRHHRPGEETWHDVQVLIRGPVAGVAARFLETLDDVTANRADPPAMEHGFRTTLSAARPRPLLSIAPLPVSSGIERTIRKESLASRDLLYFETQFFRDRALAASLAEAGKRNSALRLLMILPAAPDVIAFEGRSKLDARLGEHLQARCIKSVRDAFGNRAFFAAPAQRRVSPPEQPTGRDRYFGAPLIYVHAKLCVFDQRSVLVSSANLNGRSLHWDTEAGVFHEDGTFARAVLIRALAHWTRSADIDIDGDVVEQIRQMARHDATRQPENRDGFLLPYDSAPASRFGFAVPFIPDEMV